VAANSPFRLNLAVLAHLRAGGPQVSGVQPTTTT
jgi:hypothetical protein